MNQQDQADLERLKRRQEALQMQLANLSVDIQQLASRLNVAAQPAPEIQPLEVSPLETASPRPAVPPPLPPIIPSTVSQNAQIPVQAEKKSTPPPTPSVPVPTSKSTEL